ncbi:MAG: hypothetical protein HUU46_15800 [Candidatus Hydrogenedentes bacterium]|nr:hypothetical protein [Candidatus Hydrogenedentota bacterium]
MRTIAIAVLSIAAASTAGAGTYYVPFDLPDQVLPFDVFGNPPATVLAPAGVYQGTSDDTVMEIAGGNLVASDPTGGNVGEYSALALVAGPPDNQFTGGAIVRATILGATLEAVRDGLLPGVAVGITLVDTADNTYFLAAINRTTAGTDYFDNAVLGGLVNENLLTPGTGYFAVWQAGPGVTSAVVAVTPISAGALPDTELRVDFDASAVADFAVNGIALQSGHALDAQPDRAGIVVMSWGRPTGNPSYSGVTFGSLRADGDEVPDGGDPVPVPASRAGFVVAMAAAIACAGLVRMKRSHTRSSI